MKIKIAALLLLSVLGLGFLVHHFKEGLPLKKRVEQIDKKITFDFPSEWKLKISRGSVESFTQYLIVGPRNSDDSFSATMAVKRVPPKEVGGRFESAAQMKQNYITHLYKDPIFENDQSLRVLGLPAQEITARYTLPPLRHQGLKGLEVPLKTRQVFVQIGEDYYQLGFSADAREFGRHEKEFDRLLKSIRWSKA